ncbi:monooxygenase family protein [Streptacidiphilus anmyonensis]|uniref:monooxygenase family protein n=1 Tax=Streptacidiphilus anmyonensis TaxID=405782 RepID=UPI0007C7093A|nr:DUF4188 domain-containing protein [Streptacidiphilus anmyonensis]
MPDFGSARGTRSQILPEWTRPGLPTAPGADTRGGLLHGRHLADSEEPVAVLLIGLRVNRWRAVRHWLPALRAMTPMLKELAADPESGLLGYRLLLGPAPRQVTVVQYWRRAGDVRAFATAADRGHRPAQDAFWRRYARSKGAVGVWHELLSVRAGAYEALYADMPPTGLGAIMGLRPAVPRPGGHGYAHATEEEAAAGLHAEAGPPEAGHPEAGRPDVSSPGAARPEVSRPAAGSR